MAHCKCFSVSLVLWVLGTLYKISASNTDEKLQVDVKLHLPCVKRDNKNGENPWPIVFPSSKVVPDKSSDGNCYRMTGLVKINRLIKGKLFAYVEVKNGTSSPPIPCRNAQPDGCKGAGSCVYCDLCSTFESLTHNEVRVELKKNKSLACNKQLEKDDYDDTSLIFCMPTLTEFLKTLNIDRAAWDQFAGDGQSGQTVFMTFYVFEKEEINKLSSEKLKQKVQRLDGVVGCHKLIMNVFSTKNHKK